MSESQQHTLDRVRPPRVQITYDVETNGAMEQKELPFVVGVMSELGGDQTEAPKPLKERKFVPIDRDNFNEVLEKISPRLAMSVPNRLTDEEDTSLSVELNFKDITDFEPQNVAKQVPALEKLLEARTKLRQVLSTMEGNDKYTELLEEVLKDTEAAKTLAEELGTGAEEAEEK
jgi:type VI secretion system protein ImpB